MVFEESSNKFHFHYQSRDFYYASYRYVEQDFQFMANYTVATAIIIVVRESMYNCNSLISPWDLDPVVAAIYSYTYFRVFLKVK